MRREHLKFHKSQPRLRGAGQIGWTSKKQVGSHRKLQKPGWRNFTFCFYDNEEVGRRRWQRSQRIPGFVRKISETTGYSEIDSAYHSLSLMQRYGPKGV